LSGDGQERPSIDSRSWTGRGLGPTRADSRAAWQAFRSAAGAKAIAPRRAAAIVCGIGGVLVAPAIAIASPDRLPWLASLSRGIAVHAIGPHAARAVLEWLAAFVGPALAIALVAAVAGTVSAWRNRVALATGFAVAPADQLEGGGGDVVIALITMTSFIPTGWAPSPTKILMLWMIAFYLARGLTLMAEQLFAAPDGNGWRIANPVCATLGAAALLFASTCR